MTATTGPTPPMGDLLVPVLDLTAGAPDPASIAIWHLALSNLVGTELPHQFLGLWVFPERGGVILLGPDTLAQDQLELPIAGGLRDGKRHPAQQNGGRRQRERREPLRHRGSVRD